jgi:hypothetical protein
MSRGVPLMSIAWGDAYNSEIARTADGVRPRYEARAAERTAPNTRAPAAAWLLDTQRSAGGGGGGACARAASASATAAEGAGEAPCA